MTLVWYTFTYLLLFYATHRKITSFNHEKIALNDRIDSLLRQKFGGVLSSEIRRHRPGAADAPTSMPFGARRVFPFPRYYLARRGGGDGIDDGTTGRRASIASRHRDTHGRGRQLFGGGQGRERFTQTKMPPHHQQSPPHHQSKDRTNLPMKLPRLRQSIYKHR